MTQRILSFGAVIVALAVCVGGWRLYTSHSKTSSEQDTVKVRQMLAADIAQSSSRADVEGYLSSRNVSHSFVKTDKGERNIVVAMFRGHSDGIVRRDVQVQFRFDDSDRLVDYTVKEVLTGP